METREEVKIETIEANGAITKGDKEFVLPITYVLADGRRIDTTFRRTRKRDVVEFAFNLPGSPEHPMWANYRDGVYIGTKTSYYIGPQQ